MSLAKIGENFADLREKIVAVATLEVEDALTIPPCQRIVGVAGAAEDGLDLGIEMRIEEEGPGQTAF